MPRKPAAPAPDVATSRKALLLALEAMPDEAFGWFVVWAAGGATSPLAYKYPDGLGGFRQESRDAILALQRAAETYAATEARR
jgi:hypothetical protein